LITFWMQEMVEASTTLLPSRSVTLNTED
jgi:hypothetical protein